MKIEAEIHREDVIHYGGDETYLSLQGAVKHGIKFIYLHNKS
jgi:hypothetical protein